MKKNNEKKCPLGKEAYLKTKIKIDNKKKRVNKADVKIKRPHHTQAEMAELTEKRGKLILNEFKAGIRAVRQYPKSVTIFGSARTKPGEKYYEKTRELSSKLCNEGYAVITGGGPGIMAAANRGTAEACGSAIGFNIELPFEQNINPYVTHGVNFHYFFTRKVSMTFSGETYIYMPGGFGTLDEFFEVITLIQTKKLPKVPIILFGKDFWGPLVKYFEKTLLNKHGTISAPDLKLFTVTDDIDEVVKIVKKSKLRDEYKNPNAESFAD